jgi:hypothetical protein
MNDSKQAVRTAGLYTAARVAAGLLAVACSSFIYGQDGAAGTQPSSETARSVLMNNWTDLVAIHYSRQLYKIDPYLFGPYLSHLHSAVDWPVNQIDGATAFFRGDVVDGHGERRAGPDRQPRLCETSGKVQGDDARGDAGVRQSYASVMCFDDGGVLNVEYLGETEVDLPVQIEKSYAMVPNQRFVVARYTLTNNLPAKDEGSVRARFVEVVDLNNKTALDHEESGKDLTDTGIHEPEPGQLVPNLQAQWHPDLNAWIADMSAANGTFLVFGAFQDMDRHRTFETVTDQLEFDRAIEPETKILDEAELPEDIEELTAWDLGLAMWKEVVLPPGDEQQYSFFYAIASSLEEAKALAGQARAPTTSNDWFDDTRDYYRAWLQQGRQIDPPDPGLRSAYTRALVANKQATQPAFGNFVAATNPAYGFKVWPRDASVTALGFAAAGHLDEAQKFYRWLASVQEDGRDEKHPLGTWFTNYSYWIQKYPKTFVEPEWDSLGLFMIGTYHTWRMLNERDPQAATEFLRGPITQLDQGPTSVYEAVTRSAEYISNNVNEHGFGPADFSIWEEDFQWNTFTQVTYASGLNAARLMAESLGETERANKWLDAGRRILDAIHRPASAQPCPGLWNDAESRWNRATWPDCRRDDRLDASADIGWVFGLIDANDQRAMSMRQAVLSRLTHGDKIGISRYEGDQFYFSSPFSPGGRFEATGEMPSWPQMDMYVAMLEHWRGLDDDALERLQWYARTTNVGYMPQGEGVDWPTDRPLPSTAVEPVTASWYILGLLNHLNQFDPRLPPLGAAASSGAAPSPRFSRSR